MSSGQINLSAIEGKKKGEDKNKHTMPSLGSVLEIRIGRFDAFLGGRCRPVPGGKSGASM
jgi:hypothetical protein